MKALLALSLLVFAGCVSHSPRPVAWPDTIPAHAVADLEGTFVDRDGVFVQFFPGRAGPINHTMRLQAEGPAKVLLVFQGKDGTEPAFSSSIVIRDGWILLSKNAGVSDGGAVAFDRDAYAMRIDREGALQVRIKTVSFGFLFLIPGGEVKEYWTRLPRLPNKAPLPTILSVTPRADARVAPARIAAEL